jgi:hypothetical protein
VRVDRRFSMSRLTFGEVHRDLGRFLSRISHPHFRMAGYATIYDRLTRACRKGTACPTACEVSRPRNG